VYRLVSSKSTDRLASEAEFRNAADVCDPGIHGTFLLMTIGGYPDFNPYKERVSTAAKTVDALI
jgi:hypothetical protein